MKTLNESISDVLSKNASVEMKRNELIKLGLCKHEVRMLLESCKTSKGEFDFSKLTFGVEIEAYNFTRDSLINQCTGNGLTVKSEGYNHNDNQHYFKIVSDCSINGDNSNEVVSPILKGTKGMNSLKAMCSALAAVDARVNVSCGLHVHIGAKQMSDEHYCRLVRNYQKIEKVIDTFMPVSRRANNNQYCHSLQGINFEGCICKSSIARMMGSRYYKVNAEAYQRHGTIEFRQHSGTVDYEKISNWVKFLAKLVEYSAKHEITFCNSIEELPFLNEREKEYFINRRAALN